MKINIILHFQVHIYQLIVCMIQYYRTPSVEAQYYDVLNPKIAMDLQKRAAETILQKIIKILKSNIKLQNRMLINNVRRKNMKLNIKEPKDMKDMQ